MTSASSEVPKSGLSYWIAPDHDEPGPACPRFFLTMNTAPNGQNRDVDDMPTSVTLL